MQIPSNPYPVVRTPPAPVARRDDVRVDDERQAASEAATASQRSEPSTTTLKLPTDMQRAALRGGPAETNSSYASQRALAEYAGVATRAEVIDTGQVEVRRFDVFV